MIRTILVTFRILAYSLKSRGSFLQTKQAGNMLLIIVAVDEILNTNRVWVPAFDSDNDIKHAIAWSLGKVNCRDYRDETYDVKYKTYFGLRFTGSNRGG